MIDSLTDRFFRLSIVHVTPDALAELDKLGIEYPASTFTDDHGAFICVDDYVSMGVEPEHASLGDVLEWADQHNIQWLRIDQDGYEVDELTVYQPEGT